VEKYPTQTTLKQVNYQNLFGAGFGSARVTKKEQFACFNLSLNVLMKSI